MSLWRGKERGQPSFFPKRSNLNVGVRGENGADRFRQYAEFVKGGGQVYFLSMTSCEESPGADLEI
ncbi:MAG: hypothetical protein A2Y66_01525 [Nitrospirae bacterium RBG_13_41_22]|nr:MAG: hypothetical protein A2Y66_01525 [Nitrospirae bacterium RBG_13_41_22]